MNVRVHIERVVLDGVPLEAGGGVALQRALEGELGRLLAARSPSQALRSSAALASHRGGEIRVGPDVGAAALGRSVARAVGGLGE